MIFAATTSTARKSVPAFILATIWFDSIGIGTSTLTLAEGPGGLSDGTGSVQLDVGPINSSSATVDSNPIPEPGTVLLMGTGTMGLLAWRRWKN